MTKATQERGDRVSDARLERALAYLLAGTRRVRRGPDLLKIARELGVARRGLGSLKAVANVVGISAEMLREFASVEGLSPVVKRMIAEGRVSSVDAAYRLSMLPEADQVAVAEQYLSGKLGPRDVRDLVSFLKRNPRRSVQRAIRRIKRTRDVKRYVIKFPVCRDAADLPGLRARFAKVIGKRNVVSVEADGTVGSVTVNEEGRRRLQARAKELRTTKRKVVVSAIRGG